MQIHETNLNNECTFTPDINPSLDQEIVITDKLY